MTARRVAFTGAQGARIAAVLETPQGAACGTVLFAHCFTGRKDNFPTRMLCRGLVQSGFAVLRFDFTGLGDSEGKFEDTNFSSNVQDVLCAAEYLRREHTAPLLLVGHSLGGTVMLAAAAEIPEARAVAVIASPAEPAHLMHLFAAQEAQMQAEGVAEVQVAGRPFRFKPQFLQDIQQARVLDKVPHLHKALIIFHSAADEVVNIDNARKIYEVAQHPKSFVSLQDAEHFLADREDCFYIASVLAAWAQRYLPENSSTAPAEVAAIPQGTAVADSTPTAVQVESMGDTLAHTITTGRHTLTADEPPALGGADTGPAPYGYLLAALGACTAITLRMYARIKNLPLEKVTVHLQHAKEGSEDNRTDSITRTLQIEGDLTQEQRTRMLAIANKCPVHKTLSSSADIHTTLQTEVTQ